MKRLLLLSAAVTLGATATYALQKYESGIVWPEPKVVTPGDQPGAPPSDAIVLFDGTNLDGWTTMDGKPAAWAHTGAKGSGMAIKPGTGSIISKQKFGDCQIHVEFATPAQDAEAKKTGQDRGNSGVYIQGRYEIQVLDSYQNETYPDGQCGAIYKQRPPLVNAWNGPCVSSPNWRRKSSRWCGTSRPLKTARCR